VTPLGLLSPQPPERPQFLGAERVNRGDAVLQPGDVQEPLAEIHLIPGERAKLADPQPVSVSDQDHRGVPVTVAAPLTRRGNQHLDLGRRQILARASFAIALPSRWQCGWLADNSERRPLSRNPYCPVLSAWHGLNFSLDRRGKLGPDRRGCPVSGSKGDTPFAGTNKIVLKERLQIDRSFLTFPSAFDAAIGDRGFPASPPSSAPATQAPGPWFSPALMENWVPGGSPQAGVVCRAPSAIGDRW
jgi:hypothetical protein